MGMSRLVLLVFLTRISCFSRPAQHNSPSPMIGLQCRMSNEAKEDPMAGRTHLSNTRELPGFALVNCAALFHIFSQSFKLNCCNSLVGMFKHMNKRKKSLKLLSLVYRSDRNLFGQSDASRPLQTTPFWRCFPPHRGQECRLQPQPGRPLRKLGPGKFWYCEEGPFIYVPKKCVAFRCHFVLVIC